MEVWKIEFAENCKMLLDSWNMKTNVWLRECVYKRVTPKGKKPGFRSSLATFATSAFWVSSDSRYAGPLLPSLTDIALHLARHCTWLLSHILLLRLRPNDRPPGTDVPQTARPACKLCRRPGCAPAATDTEEAAVRLPRHPDHRYAHQLRHAAVHVADDRRLFRRVEQRGVVRTLLHRRRPCLLLHGWLLRAAPGPGRPGKARRVPDGARRD